MSSDQSPISVVAALRISAKGISVRFLSVIVLMKYIIRKAAI